jgi:transposase
MGRKCIKVTTLHGYTIDELETLIHNSKSIYTQDVLWAVTMCYKGFNTSDIMKALSKSRPTIVSYISCWNEDPRTIMDNRGGNIPSKITLEMIDNIKYVLMNKKPSDFDYPQATWNSEILTRFIADTYGPKYSSSWIRKILASLGFSYKRGVYAQTKADPVLQESFKKNEHSFGYN